MEGLITIMLLFPWWRAHCATCWRDDYPDAWPEARRKWSGILTLRNLRVLANFGRLA
ncbi:MAG: hypothetical protein AB1767_11595 [Bacillota bacterium]